MVPKESVSRPSGTRVFRTAAFAVAVFAAFLLAGCGIHDPSARRCGTEVPDPNDPVALVGCVEHGDNQPAVAARVIAWPSQDGGGPASLVSETLDSESTLTDENGRFAFGKELSQGSYDLYFEDSVAVAEKRPVQRWLSVPHGSGHLFLPSVRLVPPTLLMFTVRDNDNDSLIVGASCQLENTPYKPDTTGSGGIAHFYVPPGDYSVYCKSSQSQKDRRITIPVPPDTTSIQTDLYLFPPIEPPPLLPPKDFTVAYDENSGVVDLNWSRVRDIRLLKYGISRVDIDAGGGATQFTANDTSYKDVPFSRADSVQVKHLLYSVYSQKRDPGGSPFSRSQTVAYDAHRPWAYGPRIDTIFTLDSLGAYHAGDTVRFVAEWTNRIRENDTLFWRVSGPILDARTRAHPAASGKDTLAFVRGEAGDYQISLTILDAEGYRSWRSDIFRFSAGPSGP